MRFLSALYLVWGRQQDYEAVAQRLKKELDEAKRMADGLKAVR